MGKILCQSSFHVTGLLGITENLQGMRVDWSAKDGYCFTSKKIPGVTGCFDGCSDLTMKMLMQDSQNIGSITLRVGIAIAKATP